MSTEYIRSERYEEMAAAFQCSQIQILDRVLLKNGIPSIKAKEIVESYVFETAVLFDQYWIDTEEGKVFPVVAFSDKHQLHQPNEMHFNEGQFSFVEYTFGNISWFYEENVGINDPQKMGVGDEAGSPT